MAKLQRWWSDRWQRSWRSRSTGASSVASAAPESPTTSVTAELAVLDPSMSRTCERADSSRSSSRFPSSSGFSAVVGAELMRGARSRQARRFVEQLTRRFPLVVPSESDWAWSGAVVRTLAERHGFEAAKLRDVHFDVLIALGARRIGAHLITCHARDFRMIREALSFKLLCW